MGPGAEILMQLDKHQPATGYPTTNSSVAKNHHNKHSQNASNKKNVNKSMYFHDEIKKSIARTVAATPNNRDSKKDGKAPPSTRKATDTAKTAKSNLTSSYPPYNAKSKPIPVVVNASNKTPKGGNGKQIGLARNSPMKGVMGTPLVSFTRPISLTPPILLQSPGKGFYAGAMFETHPTTTSGLPTPPTHWTLSSTPTLQRSQSQPSTPTITSMQSALTTPGIDLASLFGSLCGNSTTTASPLAKSFQGESVSQAKQSTDSESSDEELKTIAPAEEKKKAVSKKEDVITKKVITSPKEQRGIGISLGNTCHGAMKPPGCLQEMSDQLKCLMKVAV